MERNSSMERRIDEEASKLVRRLDDILILTDNIEPKVVMENMPYRSPEERRAIVNFMNRQRDLRFWNDNDQ
jgi:hypothetical protein